MIEVLRFFDNGPHFIALIVVVWLLSFWTPIKISRGGDE